MDRRKANSTPDAEGNSYGIFAARQLRMLKRLRDLHTDMTVLQAMFLLAVAANPGATQRRIYELLDTNDSNAARTLAILSDIGGRHVPGLNLITMAVNPLDRRERFLNLSVKGKRLMDDLKEYIERV